MEEKERYVIRYDLDYNQCLIDTEENQGVGDYIRIVKLLNQQDKELSKLRASYEQVKEENQQLKQSQKQKAIEELNNLKRYCHEWYSWSDVAKRLDVVVDDRIKELKGEKNE